MKHCPKCSKTVASDAWLCDCGYEFSADPSAVVATESRHRPVFRFFAAVLAVPVTIALGYMFFVLMPSARGGSGPDVGPDLRGVLPVFVIIICGGIGSILSIVGMCRRERGAGFTLAFYILVSFIFIVPK